MQPTPGTVFWEGLKVGMAIWPFETKAGEYFALPLYIVIPALLLLVASPAVIAFLVLPQSRKADRPS